MTKFFTFFKHFITLTMLFVVTVTMKAQANEFIYIYKKGVQTFKLPSLRADHIEMPHGKGMISIFRTPDNKEVFSSPFETGDSLRFGNTEPTALGLQISLKHNVNVQYDANTQILDIETTGVDPYVITQPFQQALPSDSCVLTFEYQCTENIVGPRIYFIYPFTSERSLTLSDLKATTSDTWNTFSVNVSSQIKEFSWGKSGNRLRINVGNEKGKKLRIRYLYFRKYSAEERAAQEAEDGKLFGNWLFDIPTAHMMTVSYNSQTNLHTLQTTDGDPYVYTQRLTKNLPEDSCVLTFDYKCPKGVNDLQVFFADPTSEARSVHMGAIPSATTWTNFSYNVKELRQSLGWGRRGNRLRMDFGTTSNVSIYIKNLHMRPMNTAEKEAYDKAHAWAEEKQKIASRIKQYLDTAYTSTVNNVTVTSAGVTVKGHCAGQSNYALAEVTPYNDITETKHFSYRTDISEQDFSITLPRKVRRNGYLYDRALSKWAIVKVEGDSDILASHAHYADSVTPAYQAKSWVLAGKKGVGAGPNNTAYYNDFKELNLHSITANIVLNAFLLKSYSDGTTVYNYGGKVYYINNSAINQIDEMMKKAQEQGIIVNAILLTTTGSVFNDPENNGGYYTMPNMTTAGAVNDYAAALNYLAKRYSSGTYGRIHNWIMHNEVDMGSDWTNMGDQPMMRYLDRYVKSMRMAYNILRQYDQHASVLGSYTHNWNNGDTEYAPKQMLNRTVQYSKNEGDFMWGVAYHPYPINLAAPEYWKNDVSLATFSKNSQYCTMWNPEVINDWILDKPNLYQGKKKRLLFFSEQGTNSPSYSDEDLARQAAGAALFWKKVKQLPGIDAIQWHNWADNRAEFGLRIGLRAFADGNLKELEAKPAWQVWQAADTDQEDTVFNQYLTRLGLTNWDNIIHTVK